MDIFMTNIPYSADYLSLTLVLQPVLHGPVFARYSTSPGVPMNFKVYLFRDKRHAHSHSGRGTLTVPSEAIGKTFLDHFGNPSNKIRVGGQYIFFKISNKSPRPDVLGEIQLMPYRDPRAIRETEQRLADLSGVVDLRDVQFAWMCRDGSLSIEWQWNSDDDPINWLADMEYGTVSHSLCFNEATREVFVKKNKGITETTIAMRYSRILIVETDTSTKPGPTILLMLETPPSFEEMAISNHIFALVEFGFKPPKRRRLTHLNAKHAPVAPFTCTLLRLVCRSLAGLAEFKRMADTANLHVHDRYRSAEKKGLFSPRVMKDLERWLRNLDWTVAFQCEALHRALLLDTVELLDLRPSIDELALTQGSQRVTQILRQFGLRLRDVWNREDDQSVRSCFDQAKAEVTQGGTYPQPTTTDRIFQCLHVTFTPTGMKLRGPFPDTSNRIIRQYPNNQDCFLRVSFTDEDGLKFRFDRREVDGNEFIERRVGTILNDGFELSGRRFEFLAYSQSALKQYTVWFVTRFHDMRGRTVNAEHIRGSIGTRWPVDVRRCPARFAARLSQAFTATESSVFVEPDQIETIPDIERNGYCFSDGNGSLSQEMADAIHDALQSDSGRTNRNRRVPSVFQVRIQGAKGVLSVDTRLSDLRIDLRPSMVKFESANNRGVEIARSFTKPGKLFLNRPLAMILAGLGVDTNVFLSLQRDAVEETQESVKSLRRTARLFETHGLGTAFSLPSTLLNLRKMGLELEENVTPTGLRDAFVERSLRFAVHHVLREIKFKARIPVPDSWKLVGVVDIHNILLPNQIYACIVKGEGSTPEYLSGPILISKSPTIHSGDVQIAQAIGTPPVDSPLRALINCVVFSQQGDRPLPNQLSGSDLDGDEYDLITYLPLHPASTWPPGEYPATPRLILERDSTMKDVTEFVVNYINNDMLGVVATNFLLIADTSGIFAPECKLLAELHSWAVDFPKNGIPVPADKIPYPQHRVKPDWHSPEINTALSADYYVSNSILGKLFRAIHLPALSATSYDSKARQRRRGKQESLSLEDTLGRLSLDSASLSDPISIRLRRRLLPLVNLEHAEELTLAITNLFDHFSAELEHICFSYTMSRKATSRLTEEEVFTGTIIAMSTQPRMRQDAISGMREESSIIVRRILKELEGGENASVEDWVNRCWTAWRVSIMKKDLFGSKSFGWIALRGIFEAIKALED